MGFNSGFKGLIIQYEHYKSPSILILHDHETYILSHHIQIDELSDPF